MSDHEEQEPGMDASLAPVALFLFITSIWLHWWVVRWEDAAGFRYDEVAVRLFGSGGGVAHNWGPMVTGTIVALATLMLFVRVAAKSWFHEPPSWRRDLWIVTLLGSLALASTLTWPAEVPSFWGGRTYTLVNDTAQQFTERALPGLGWWIGLLGTLVAGAAAVFASRGAKAP